MNSQSTLREVTRGEILRQLVEFYPSKVTRRTLLNLMDLANYPVLDEDLDFHLSYLADKGYLELELSDQVVGKAREILMVRITTRGIDFLDQRRGPGVR